MATHINAYFAAVDEAKTKVQLAKGELEAAELALETKKKEVGYVEPEAEITETIQTREDEQPEPADEPENVNRHTVFQRKK